MEDRFIRQASLVPADRLAAHDIHLVGCGAVGRQVGLFLASMGARKITLYDHDIVENVNVTTQGYKTAEIGMHKVDALKEEIMRIDPTIEVVTHARRWKDGDGMGTAGFMCVDSISTREFIWKKLLESGQVPEFYGDARTLGEIGKVVCIGGPTADSNAEHYGNSFFKESDTEQGLCTARLTIYSASMAAAMLCHMLARHLRDLPVDHEVQWGMLAAEMNVPELRENPKPVKAKKKGGKKKKSRK